MGDFTEEDEKALETISEFFDTAGLEEKHDYESVDGTMEKIRDDNGREIGVHCTRGYMKLYTTGAIKLGRQLLKEKADA